MAVSAQMTVVRFVMPCRLVGGYWCFEGACYLHFCGWSQVRIWPSYIGRVTQIVVTQN